MKIIKRVLVGCFVVCALVGIETEMEKAYSAVSKVDDGKRVLIIYVD